MRMTRARYWAGGILGVLLLLGGAGWYLLVHDINWLRDSAGRYASAQAGRAITVGDLSIQWSSTPRIILRDLHLANAEWSDEKEMAAAERIEVVIELWPLLRGRVVLPEIVLEKPVLVLERQGDGTSNWTLGPKLAAEAVTPDKRADMPLIGALTVNDGRLRYRDAKAGLDIDGQIATAAGAGGKGQGEVRLNGTGTLQGAPFRLNLAGGSLLQLREGDEPYPLRIELITPENTAAFAGTLTDPITFDGVNIDVRLRGENLGKLTPLTGVPLPETPPYDLRGHLRRDGGIFIVDDMQGRVGQSDLNGSLHFDTTKERLFIDADLHSKRLDYRDVGPLVGIPVIQDGGEVKVVPRKPLQGEDFIRVLPNAPLALAQVRAVDARLKYRADSVEAPNTPLERVALDLELQNGVLSMKPLRLSVAGGDVLANIVVDASRSQVMTRYDIGLRRFRLERFLEAAGQAGRGTGQINGRIRLEGMGDTLAKSLATSSGEIRIVMGEGTLSNLALELVGLDIAETLGFLAGGDRTVQLRCMVADFSVSKGVMQPRLLLLDTTDTTLTARGHLDLGQEALDLRVLAHPKDPSPLSIRAPITVRGHFGVPRIGVDATTLAARGLGAVVLGTLLTPLAAILAFIEPGLEEDSNCAALLAAGGPPPTPQRKPAPPG